MKVWERHEVSFWNVPTSCTTSFPTRSVVVTLYLVLQMHYFSPKTVGGVASISFLPIKPYRINVLSLILAIMLLSALWHTVCEQHWMDNCTHHATQFLNSSSLYNIYTCASFPTRQLLCDATYILVYVGSVRGRDYSGQLNKCYNCHYLNIAYYFSCKALCHSAMGSNAAVPWAEGGRGYVYGWFSRGFRLGWMFP